MNAIFETGKMKAKWTIRRYRSEDFDRLGFEAETYHSTLPPVSVFENNLLLNEGIAELWDICATGSGTKFDNANAYLGVGDDNTAASASQTGLQAATNKLYKAMEATYPQRSAQTVTWRSVFGTADANWSWNEFTVANGNSDAADNLNRKVEAEGTKAAGQTWTLDLEITLS